MITIKDRSFKSIAQAHHNGRTGLVITDDKMITDLSTGVTSYEFEIEKTDERIANIVVGNYVIVNDGDISKTLEIIEIDETNYSKRCYCEDCALDLLGTEVGPYEAIETHDLKFYVDLTLQGTGWELGTNQMTGKTRKLKYESSTTVIKRLRQIANAFECEFNFKQTLTEVDAISYRHVNFYKRIGLDNNVRLEFGREILEIERTESLSKLATSVLGVGDSGINLSKTTYDEYPYILKSGYLIDLEAVKRWKRPSYVTQDLGIVKHYYSSAKTEDRLLQETLRKLKQWSVPEVTYVVKVNNVNLGIGDSVVVIDNNYMPALQLSARVSKVIKSIVDPTKNTIEISNIVESTDTIDERVADLRRKVNEATSEVKQINDNIEDLDSRLDTKADLQLTQDELDAINERQKQLVEELKAKASLEAIKDFEKAYLEFVEAGQERYEQAEQQLINMANRMLAVEKNYDAMAVKWNFIDRDITFGEEGMKIANEKNDSYILMNDDGITMWSNGNQVLSIADGVLKIDNGVFVRSLQIGWYVRQVYERNEYCNVRRYVGPNWNGGR